MSKPQIPKSQITRKNIISHHQLPTTTPTKTHPICIGGKKVMKLSLGVPQVNFSNLLTYFSDLSHWVLPLFSTDLGPPWDVIVTHIRLFQFVLGEKKLWNYLQGYPLRCDCHTYKTHPICIQLWNYLRGYPKSIFRNLLTYFSDLSHWVLLLFSTDLGPPWDAIVTLIRLIQFVLGEKKLWNYLQG